MKELKKSRLGRIDGQEVTSYILDIGGDLVLGVIDYGLAIQSLSYLGTNRILSFDNPKDFLRKDNYFGKTLGRVAEKISGGMIRIDGIEYPLDKNHGEDCLNGGFCGFSKRVWSFEGCRLEKNGDEIEKGILEFSLKSSDMEGGFPGTIEMNARLNLSHQGEFTVEYYGNTDRKTPLAVTNELFFNFHEDKSLSILDHELWINSHEYLVLNEKRHPKFFTHVDGSPFDYQSPRTLFSGIEELKNDGEKGLEHPFILDSDERVVTLSSKMSGVELKVITTEPVVLINTGNDLEKRMNMEGGVSAFPHQGVAIKPQWFPNALNTEFLPDNLFNPEDSYYTKSIYRFSKVENDQYSEK